MSSAFFFFFFVLDFFATVVLLNVETTNRLRPNRVDGNVTNRVLQRVRGSTGQPGERCSLYQPILSRKRRSAAPKAAASGGRCAGSRASAVSKNAATGAGASDQTS